MRSDPSELRRRPVVDKDTGRLVFIDAWRGIASLAVLIGHLYVHSPFLSTFENAVPSWLREIIWRSGLAVVAFFVISGFVIAYSVRDLRFNAGSVSRFALRRQVRLDPVYWVAIVVALALLLLDGWLGRYSEGVPSVWAVLANLLYLQNIFGAREIVSNAWTLCIEIQFYVAFVFIMWLSALVKTGLSRVRFSGQGVEAFAVTLLALVGLWYCGTEYGRTAWFLAVWIYFALGVLVCWSLLGRISEFATVVALVATATLAFLSRSEGLAIGAATATLFYAVGSMGRLSTLWNGRTIQFFGRISYSLYIIHVPIGCHFVMKAGYKMTGSSLLSGILWAVAGGATSVFAAWVLWRMVERPSQRWAGRMRREDRGSGRVRVLRSGHASPILRGGS